MFPTPPQANRPLHAGRWRPLQRRMQGWQERSDRVDGSRQGLLFALALLVAVLPQVVSETAAPSTGPMAREHAATAEVQPQLDLGAEPASDELRQLALWVLRHGDHGARPFVILDKRNARVFVFEASGRLHGATPVLLGYAQGDDSVAGIGQRPIADVRPEERTTPAGRFNARPGRNLLAEDVLWVDYEAAVSMHRVRITDPKERRMERLASSDASERRISYGCINLPVAFFEKVLWPKLGRSGGIVYVLPEVKPLSDVFPQLAPSLPRVLARHLT